MTSISSWLRKELKAPKWVNFCARAALALSGGTDFELDLLLGTPNLPRPRDFFRFLDRARRDRSKKYTCSYFWTGPDRASFRIGEKSTNNTKITTFCVLYESFAPWPVEDCNRTISNAQNIHFLHGAFNSRSNYAKREAIPLKSLRSGNSIMIE